MKLIYLKLALKCDSFDVAIGIKIPFFRVLVSIEPGRSLVQFVTTNCLKPKLRTEARLINRRIECRCGFFELRLLLFRHILERGKSQHNKNKKESLDLPSLPWLIDIPSMIVFWQDHISIKHNFIMDVYKKKDRLKKMTSFQNGKSLYKRVRTCFYLLFFKIKHNRFPFINNCDFYLLEGKPK